MGTKHSSMLNQAAAVVSYNHHTKNHNNNKTHYNNCDIHPEIQKQVMEYLQEYDQNRSIQGRRNKMRNEIELDSLQQLLKDKEALEGLIQIIRTNSKINRYEKELFLNKLSSVASRAA